MARAEAGKVPDVKPYSLMRLPWWIRGLLAGLIFGLFMLVYLWPDDSSGVMGRLAVAAILGVLLAIGVGLLGRAFERQIFHADGRVLTAEERIAVLRAAESGRWPDDTRLHPAVSRLAGHWLRRSEKPALQMTVFGLALAVALVNVVRNGPWWWCAVVFWAVVGPLALRNGKRHRASVQALRAAAQAGGRS